MTIEELLAQLEQKQKEALEKSLALNKAIDEKADAKEVSGLKALLDEKEKQIAAIAEQIKATDKILCDIQAEAKRNLGGANGKKKTLGETFIADDAFIAAQKVRANNFAIELKTAIVGTAGNGLLGRTYDGIYPSEGDIPNSILPLIPAIAVSTGNVEFIRFTRISAAAAQAAQGSQKVEGAMSFALINQTIQTIANSIPASRQVLSDSPQLQSILDGELVYSLYKEIEKQILVGDGTSGNLNGITLDAGISDIGGFATGTTATPQVKIDHILDAIGVIKDYGFAPNAIIMGRSDTDVIRKSRDSSGRYLLNGAFEQAGRVFLWGVPVIENATLGAGNFLVGDFTQGAKLYQRENINIRVSDQDRDNFVKNMITILGETRLALAVTKPAAFAIGDFTVAPSGA
jgi:HK97 family phage major capsid protein